MASFQLKLFKILHTLNQANIDGEPLCLAEEDNESIFGRLECNELIFCTKPRPCQWVIATLESRRQWRRRSRRRVCTYWGGVMPRLGWATLIPTESTFATFRVAGGGVHKGTDMEKERKERGEEQKWIPSFPHLPRMWVHPLGLCRLLEQRGRRRDGEALCGHMQRAQRRSLQVTKTNPSTHIFLPLATTPRWNSTVAQQRNESNLLAK